MSADKVTTRSKTKLKLVLSKDTDSHEEFTPAYRSTELHTENPFKKSARISRSPVRTTSPLVSLRNVFQFPPLPVRTESPPASQTSSTSSQSNIQDLEREEVINTSQEKDLGQPINKPETLPNPLTPDNIPPVQSMANVTLSQSLTTAKTPAKPKFICPPTFSPCSGSASSFIKNYERTAAANGWDETLKIGYLDTFLEGAADLWFQRYKDLAANGDKKWSEVKQDFLQEFESEDLKRVMERRLYARKQKPEESIKSYYYELQNLFGEYDGTFNLNEFRKFFENGIRSDLYQSYRLIVADNMDWDDFKTIINKLEDISHPPVSIPQTLTPNTGTSVQCNCSCSHPPPEQQGPPRNYYQGARAFQNRPFPPRQNNFNFNRNTRPQGYGNQSYQAQVRNPRNPRGNNTNNLPITRTHDGRPKCYLCNRIGHYASACNTRNGNRYPNANGRHN